MNVTTSLLLSLLWLQATPPPQTLAPVPPQVAPREWIVVLVSPVYLPDGGVRAENVALPMTGAGLVHVFSRSNLCSPSSTGAAEPNDASFGWRIASQIVTRSENDVVVSLEWRRIWDGGKKINNGPFGNVQLTLHPGDRIPLDHIPNSAPPQDCRAVGLGLEVRLARTPPAAPAPAAASLPLGATPGGAKPVNAELWLTHTSPNDTAQVFHQIVRLAESGGRFSFTPTTALTARGDLNVELNGTIDRYRSPDGGEWMVLSMNRVVSGAAAPAGVSETSGMVVSMPGASDVVSFEWKGASGTGAVRGGGGGGGATAAGGAARGARGGGDTGGARGTNPPAGFGSQGRGGGGGGGRGGANINPAQLATLLQGHQFSLRMRVTPVNGS